MNNTNTGGPAFPTILENRPGAYGTEGVTVRDYFAAKAMQGIVSDPNTVMSMAKVAEWSYDQADAMLKARDA